MAMGWPVASPALTASSEATLLTRAKHAQRGGSRACDAVWQSGVNLSAKFSVSCEQ
jgi:hypothetical protein